MNRQRVTVRVAVLAMVLASLALLAAGCGGAKAPSVASLGATDRTTTPDSAVQAQIKWAACIRAHGVPNFPDPNSQGEVNLAGINIHSPQFLASHRDCSSLVPPNHGRTPAHVQQLVQHELAVAQCMRKHGVPRFPDPNSHGELGWPQSVTSTPIGAKAARICNPGTG